MKCWRSRGAAGVHPPGLEDPKVALAGALKIATQMAEALFLDWTRFEPWQADGDRFFEWVHFPPRRGTGGPYAGEPCAVRISEAGGRALLTRAARSSAAESFWLTVTALPLPSFSKVFILKAVEALCFDTLLEVLILKVVTRHIHPQLRVLILNNLEIENGMVGRKKKSGSEVPHSRWSFIQR